ncbi:uncharacterized protein LOC17886101 [Capsella rubella]|uniref:uncharacterized protein LOC17886101 n=1 Tax=Capsella rubella TaxID=81985 RepID=UPI000CD579B2|nr:uncharacterized protein LOC17886101 [Capsella rubella]
MADKIRRQMQEIALGIEDEKINLPIDLCEEAIQATRFSLIVKPVNPRKQNLRAMLGTLPRLWGVNDEVSGRILENKRVQFLFPSEESMAAIVRRGPWSFNDWMCVTERWTPNQTNEDLKTIPFWIQIRGIPVNYLTLRLITFIGDSLGHFLETDFGGDGATCVLKFRYEKLRNFCSVCGLMTHDVVDCPSGHNPPPPPADEDNDDPDYNPEDLDANQQDTPEEHPRQSPQTTTEKETTPTASKKRKTDSTPSSEFMAFPMVCSDTRHTFATEDTQQCFSKRNRRQSEVLETRNWFLLQTEPVEHAPGATEGDTSINHGDGTVGHKPPEAP